MMASMFAAVADGRMELFAPLEADNPATRSNDARVHPSGTFWLGTMGRKAEPRAGAIYALHRGRICRASSPTSPSRMRSVFRRMGRIGYFADTATNIMHRVPLDAATGLPRGRARGLHPSHGRRRASTAPSSMRTG